MKISVSAIDRDETEDVEVHSCRMALLAKPYPCRVMPPYACRTTR